MKSSKEHIEQDQIWMTCTKMEYMTILNISNLDTADAQISASKDIRSGDLTRAKGIELVKAMDHIKPKDLYRWLEYVGMKSQNLTESQIIFVILEYGDGAIQRDGLIRGLFKN